MTLEIDPDGGIDSVPGFAAHGVHAGLKYKNPDLALVVSDTPCAAAGAFTTNAFAAPPVQVTRERLDGPVRAIVCNSAVANACTGLQGLEDARAMADITAKAAGLAPHEVLVASTGVIGRPLPMDDVAAGIHDCAAGLASPDGFQAAEAITTTDTHAKHVACTAGTPDGPVHVGAIAKGSGMIHPNMATMLAFVATDAPIAREHLQPLVSSLVDETFNMISVDGDESTNDMVLVLANGQAKVDPIEPGTSAFEALEAALETVFDEMARQIAADGEGATSLMQVQITGAATVDDARSGARAIAASNLVKTALHGRDPNWGRVVAALGATGASVDPDAVTLTVRGGGHAATLVRAGTPHANGHLETAAQALAADEVTLAVDLALGPHEATAYGCDLSREYVTINADYTT